MIYFLAHKPSEISDETIRKLFDIRSHYFDMKQDEAVIFANFEKFLKECEYVYIFYDSSDSHAIVGSCQLQRTVAHGVAAYRPCKLFFKENTPPGKLGIVVGLVNILVRMYIQDWSREKRIYYVANPGGHLVLESYGTTHVIYGEATGKDKEIMDEIIRIKQFKMVNNVVENDIKMKSQFHRIPKSAEGKRILAKFEKFNPHWKDGYLLFGMTKTLKMKNLLLAAARRLF